MAESYRAFHEAIQDIYDSGEEIIQLTEKTKPPRVSREAFNKAAQAFHEAKGKLSDDKILENGQQLLEETYATINHAVEAGYSLSYQPDKVFRAIIQENVYIFSGMKTYTQLKELGTLLLDEAGEFKSWSKFKADALNIHKEYNVNYLSAEYNHAVNSAQMGSQWQHWQKDGDRYYLQYRIRGVNTRPSHAAMENITLPMSDPFWDKYLPPNDWNCFCSAKQVLKATNTESDSKIAQGLGDTATTRIGKDGTNKAEIFRFNPGKDKIIFPKHHPYYKNSLKKTKLEKMFKDFSNNS